MSKTKTLTAYLFESLEEISKATDANIETAVKKAKATIEVSQQVLNVAQMKIEVIAATGTLSDAFEEICDKPFELPPADNNNREEKNNTSEPEIIEPHQGDDLDNVTTYGNRSVSKTTLGNRKVINRGY